MVNNITDEELIDLVHENNDEAKEELFNRYKSNIDYLLKKYTNIAKHLNMELTDLYQEGLVSFTDAINSYDYNKDASLSTFITLCVERKFKKACIKAGRKKNKIYADTLSLEYVYDESECRLEELIEDVDSDPLYKITDEEEYKELYSKITSSLSEKENEVFILMTNGLTYTDIAVLLNKETKQIDNTIQRIKNKIKKILLEKNNY